GNRERLADRPEREQPDTKLALQASAVSIRLQMPFDGIANVGSHILEVRDTFRVTGDAVTVVFNREVMLAMFTTARNRDRLCVCVDRVLDELGNRLQGIALRQSDDADRVPVVADTQFAALGILCPRGLRFRG